MGHEDGSQLGPLKDGLPEYPSKGFSIRPDLDHLRLIERKALGLK